MSPVRRKDGGILDAENIQTIDSITSCRSVPRMLCCSPSTIGLKYDCYGSRKAAGRQVFSSLANEGSLANKEGCYNGFEGPRFEEVESPQCGNRRMKSQRIKMHKELTENGVPKKCDLHENRYKPSKDTNVLFSRELNDMKSQRDDLTSQSDDATSKSDDVMSLLDDVTQRCKGAITMADTSCTLHRDNKTLLGSSDYWFSVSTPGSDKFSSISSNNCLKRRVSGRLYRISKEQNTYPGHSTVLFQLFSFINDSSLSTMVIVLLTLFIPIVSPQTTSGPPVFIQKPVNVSQIVGGNVTLDCSVSNLQSRVITWNRVDGAQVLLFFGGAKYTAPDWYSVNLTNNSLAMTITGVQQGDDGLFQCFVPGLQAVASVTVLVPPNVPTISPQSFPPSALTEGLFIQLSCNSSGGNPPPSLTWLRGGVAVPSNASHWTQAQNKFGVTNSVLTWFLTKADNGMNFSCTSLNTAVQQSLVSDSLQLAVRYQPGSANITLPVGAPLIGDNVTLSCTTVDTGNPAAVMQWSRQDALGNVTMLMNGSRLSLAPVRLSDSGNYSCVALNDVGSGPLDVRWLNVLELPTGLSGNTPLIWQVALNKTTPGVATCSARGQPFPQIVWLQGGQPIDVTSGDWFQVVTERRSINTYSWNVTSTLVWTGNLRSPDRSSVALKDDGNYSCLINSTIGGPLTNQIVSLTVIYAPVMAAILQQISVDIGAGVTLLCSLNASPAPNISWFRSEIPLLGNETGYQFVTVNGLSTGAGKQYAYTSKLVLLAVGASDVGLVYSCQAANNLGSSTTQFNISVATTPSAPKNLTVMSQTWESVQLSWLPGQDGGYTQTFIVNCVSDSSNFDNHTQVLPSTGSNNVYNMTGLYPSTSYTCMIRSMNRLGVGNPSNSVAILTGVRPTDDWYVKIIIIVVCVCGGVIIILSVILAVVCCRKSSNKKLAGGSSLPVTRQMSLQPVLRSENGSNASSMTQLAAAGGHDNLGNDLAQGIRPDNDYYVPTNVKEMYSIRRDVQPESEVGERRSDEESSFGSDSGVSTNETSKSKRVIYEIVV